MKKSVFTFGLLASSLVMLSVMPLLNNNSFLSNPAIAQEYDKYGDSSYSQYPTDDKKYECRTGPFEGFFVSSVEFCKHVKFDDNKKDNRDNNQTGTQGPPGPAGPQGPQGIQGIQGPIGIQGPPGISQLNNTNTYRVDNSTTSNPLDVTDTTAFGFALCDSGDFVINGGYNTFGSDIVSNDAASTLLDESVPSPLIPIPRSGWVVSVQANEIASEIALNINAICFDNPPLRP